MLRTALKSVLKRTGLHLFTNDSLPPGVDWLADAKKLGLPAAATFFDVGANIGQTVFEIREGLPEARIFAFEPFPATFAKLEKSVAHLPGVQVFPLALGASPGTLEVATHEDSRFNSLVGTGEAASGAQADAGAVSISVDTIDAFCARQDIAAIDVLKTDTEGYDVEVLAGAGAMLAAGRVRYVYAEVTFCRENRQNTPFAPLSDLLAAKDFHFMGLYETYPLHHFPEPNVFCNALFVHRSHYRPA